jgi:hypothetical protein
LTVVYPERWKTSLDAATAQAKFRVILPNHELANSSNIAAAYVWPDGNAVALQFPAPSPDSQVRQPYREVWESPWTGGDPLKDFQKSLAAAPAVGQTITSIGGIPALSVTARSPTDSEEANPAFLRFVLGGVEIQISGGENLTDLIQIAQSMIP